MEAASEGPVAAAVTGVVRGWMVVEAGTCNRTLPPIMVALDAEAVRAGCVFCPTVAIFCMDEMVEVTTGAPPTVEPVTGPGPTRKSWYCPVSVLTNR